MLLWDVLLKNSHLVDDDYESCITSRMTRYNCYDQTLLFSIFQNKSSLYFLHFINQEVEFGSLLVEHPNILGLVEVNQQHTMPCFCRDIHVKMSTAHSVLVRLQCASGDWDKRVPTPIQINVKMTRLSDGTLTDKVSK